MVSREVPTETFKKNSFIQPRISFNQVNLAEICHLGLVELHLFSTSKPGREGRWGVQRNKEEGGGFK